jgi:hypothetical protein
MQLHSDIVDELWAGFRHKPALFTELKGFFAALLTMVKLLYIIYLKRKKIGKSARKFCKKMGG